MAVTLDLSSDYLVLDRLEPVAWRRANSTVSADIASATRTTIGTRYLDAGGVVKQGDVWWDIPRALLAETPAPADAIVDGSGVVWTVLAVEKLALADWWRCSCRNLAIAANLRDLVKIEIATVDKESSGAIRRTWTLYRAGVPARVQRGTAGAGDDHGAREQTVSVEIHLGESIPVGREARVIAADGATYNVTGWRQPDSIGEPMVLEAELTPWPST